MFDPKIVLETGTTDRYGISVLNPDGSLVGSGEVNSTLYTMLLDYTGSSLPTYIGEAIAGSISKGAQAIWRIKKLTYDVNDNIVSVSWATGDNSFTHIWNDRATIIYS